MPKIVINTCYGGFSLSPQAEQEYLAAKVVPQDESFYSRIPRDDKVLVEIVERLGSAANGKFAKLKVVKIPRGVQWQIEEHDGLEWIAEKHRTWS